MELLLLLYAMLAGLAGVSGQGPARAQEVALGSATTTIEAAERGAQATAAVRAIPSARAGLPLDALRTVGDARRDDVPLTILALIPLSRQAPERRLE